MLRTRHLAFCIALAPACGPVAPTDTDSGGSASSSASGPGTSTTREPGVSTTGALPTTSTTADSCEPLVCGANTGCPQGAECVPVPGSQAFCQDVVTHEPLCDSGSSTTSTSTPTTSGTSSTTGEQCDPWFCRLGCPAGAESDEG